MFSSKVDLWWNILSLEKRPKPMDTACDLYGVDCFKRCQDISSNPEAS